MKSERVSIDVIEISPSHRRANPATVASLAESLGRIGLMQPIQVYAPDDQTALLVSGRHRLEAARSLGWEEIDAFLVDGDKIDLRLREISENLHRSELTVQERSDQIAEWAELVEQKDQFAQLAQIESKRADGRGHRTEGGNSKAARDLGLDRDQVRRAKQIASITPEAKAAAEKAGIDDNQSKLLAVAKEDPAKQVAKVIELAANPLNHFETKEQWLSQIMRIWNKGSKEWREEFLSRIDSAVMDQRYG